MQKIIRNDSTLDRPDFRVSTEQVIEVAKLFDQPFTSGDIAEALRTNLKYRGVSYSRMERSVRACLSWMVLKEVARIAGEEQHITSSGFTSKPFIYAINHGKTWSAGRLVKAKPVLEDENRGGFEILNRIFVYR